jgi:predicted O-methyltransferase YrrM
VPVGGSISEPAGPTDPGRAYAETYLVEDEVLVSARQRGIEVGAPPIGAGGGAALRFLAAAIGARHVVEVGTGCGVSGIWLLRGMAPDGVLTSVDVEPEHQRLAKQAFGEAGVAPARTRLIAGRALDVLPRLTDAAYDLVFADGEKTEYADYLAEAIRLLRPGGVVAFDNALARNRVGEASARDEYTVAVRELGRLVRDEPRLVPAMLPVGDGLLVGVRLADAE